MSLRIGVPVLVGVFLIRETLASASMTPDPQVVSYIVAAIGTAMAVFERLRAVKKDTKSGEDQTLLGEAKMYRDRSEVLKGTAEANLKFYVDERNEHQKTREFWHAKATDFQKSLSECQEKLAEVQGRPDFSELMRYMHQQAELQTKLLQGLDAIMTFIKSKV